MASAQEKAPSVTIIIPAARDGPCADKKPAWLLKHPRGNILLENVLQELGLENVKRIILAVKQEHIDEFCGGDREGVEQLILQHLRVPSSSVGAGGGGSAGSTPFKGSSAQQGIPGGYEGEFHVHVITRETTSAPDTIVETIEQCGVDGPIFIKDCDGSFKHKVEAGSYVVGMKLDTQSNVDDLPSKSFLECNGTILSNIQEKQIISDIIGVGGYGFESSKEFVEVYQRITKVQELAGKAMGSTKTTKFAPPTLLQPPIRLFTSHLVYHLMLEQRKVFGVAFVKSLDDWKTEASWRKYVSKHSNILIPLEGVLFANNSNNVLLTLTDETKTLQPISKNIEYLQRIVKEGRRSKILVTTQRPESRREETIDLLTSHEIPFDDVVFGMLGSMSYMIGAYGNEVQHPSAVSFCVPYGSAQLGSILHLN